MKELKKSMEVDERMLNNFTNEGSGLARDLTTRCLTSMFLFAQKTSNIELLLNVTIGKTEHEKMGKTKENHLNQLESILSTVKHKFYILNKFSIYFWTGLISNKGRKLRKADFC